MLDLDSNCSSVIEDFIEPGFKMSGLYTIAMKKYLDPITLEIPDPISYS